MKNLTCGGGVGGTSLASTGTQTQGSLGGCKVLKLQEISEFVNVQLNRQVK